MIQEEEERGRHLAPLIVLRLFSLVADFPSRNFHGRDRKVRQLQAALCQRQALPQTSVVRPVGEGGPRTPQHRHRGVRLERGEATGK